MLASPAPTWTKRSGSTDIFAFAAAARNPPFGRFQGAGDAGALWHPAPLGAPRRLAPMATLGFAAKADKISAAI
jgi:hypothetical protein